MANSDQVNAFNPIRRKALACVLPIPGFAVLWLLFFYAYCLRVWLALG